MKTWKVLGIVTIVVVAFGAIGVGVVFAKSAIPRMGTFVSGLGYGSGHMGGSGMMGGSSQQNHMQGIDMDAMHDLMMGQGGMHEQVLNDVAKAIGLTPAQLTTELKNNKSLADIAKEKGVSTQQLAGILQTAIQSGLKQAVADGTLTQAQADAMLKHMDGNYEQMLTYMGLGMGTGAGGCHGNDNGQNTSSPSL